MFSTISAAILRAGSTLRTVPGHLSQCLPIHYVRNNYSLMQTNSTPIRARLSAMLGNRFSSLFSATARSYSLLPRSHSKDTSSVILIERKLLDNPFHNEPAPISTPPFPLRASYTSTSTANPPAPRVVWDISSAIPRPNPKYSLNEAIARPALKLTDSSES